MEHKSIIWIIWSVSAVLFVFASMGMGIFAFASIEAPGTSIMERAYYKVFFRILFICLPLFQLSTILFALYAWKHGIQAFSYMILFLPYLLVPIVFVVGQNKGKTVMAESKRLRDAFYASPPSEKGALNPESRSEAAKYEEALLEIWGENSLTSVSQFLHFWPQERDDSCRVVFVEIDQALRQGLYKHAVELYKQVGKNGFWDNVSYAHSDTGSVEDIEFWIYEHIVKNKMENLKRPRMFKYGSNNPLLSTAEELRFLSPSDAGFMETETPEEIRQRAQRQYEYRTSPPPTTREEYIQYYRKAKEENRKNNKHDTIQRNR